MFMWIWRILIFMVVTNCCFFIRIQGWLWHNMEGDGHEKVKLPRLTTFYWSLTFFNIFFKPNSGNKTYSFSGVNFIATDIHWQKAVISSTTRLKKLTYVRIYITTRTQIANFSRVAKTIKRMNSSPVFFKLTLSSRWILLFSVWDCPFTAERMKR